ncbi:hypothetical protein ACJMK2_009297 [Sinanodonta woodiana]|uniref:BTB domain-containing protein n=1 Tax=Sinanodonta woodiana TaxID=1069815 RepID=A0ABD3VD10_SINWO
MEKASSFLHRETIQPENDKCGLFFDNSSAVLDKLSSLILDGDLSDVQLRVGRQTFNAHKLILCSRSDVFRTMLTSPTWPEAHTKQVVLKEDEECVEVFGIFLNYLYTGRIVLKESNALPILTLGDKYNVPDLSRACLEFMCTHCLPSASGYIVMWLQYAIFCGSKRLEDICQQFVLHNFQMIAQTPVFNLMHVDILCSFMKSSDVVVKDEFHLYLAVKGWFNAQTFSDRSERETLFQKVMNHIRFPMMQLDQLAYLEYDELVKEFKDFFLQKLFDAIKHRSLDTSSRCTKDNSTVRSSCLQYSVRNYINDTWSTSISVEKLNLLLPGEVQGAFFSTPFGGSSVDQHWDWHLNLYPKGICFQQCLMIQAFSNKVIEETMYKTVRLSISSDKLERRAVSICVFVVASQDGTEYICSGVSKYMIFDKEKSLCNINDIVDFNELHKMNSPFCVGEDKNTFKVLIIIKPMG